ncbi:DUS14-like protein [Mya arenaria]|uniref:DUS14-like protein n=1 Tax=Mya arenaria TaxID=6604 RepID=A0ABY7EJZ8_MYAAR|nr:dual specificity protein phosphatase 18-like [Mya arenaria]WAR09257.1 DUS14-like protein [Mya arenaria]
MKAFRSPIAQVDQNVYLCGIGCIKEENLKNRGITHILNTAEELAEFQYPALDNLSVRHILMRDAENQDLLAFLDTCVDHIHSVTNSGGTILVHCVAGVSRSASVCMAYLVKYKNKTLFSAYQHIFNQRPCICPNLGFWQQLAEYELQLSGSCTIEMLPMVLGMVPSVMKKDAEFRIRTAWMQDLVSMFSVHFILLLIQILSMYFWGN